MLNAVNWKHRLIIHNYRFRWAIEIECAHICMRMRIRTDLIELRSGNLQGEFVVWAITYLTFSKYITLHCCRSQSFDSIHTNNCQYSSEIRQCKCMSINNGNIIAVSKKQSMFSSKLFLYMAQIYRLLYCH